MLIMVRLIKLFYLVFYFVTAMTDDTISKSTAFQRFIFHTSIAITRALFLFCPGIKFKCSLFNQIKRKMRESSARDARDARDFCAGDIEF